MFKRRYLLSTLIGLVVIALFATVVFGALKVQEKYKILGEKTEQSPTPRPDPTTLPTPTPQVIIEKVVITPPPQPTLNPMVDVESICEAKKDRMAAEISATANNEMKKTEVQMKADPVLYQVWVESISPNIQGMLVNWTRKTLADYKVYCLTHNGDDKGWTISSGPFDNIKW